MFSPATKAKSRARLDATKLDVLNVGVSSPVATLMLRSFSPHLTTENHTVAQFKQDHTLFERFTQLLCCC